MPCSTYPLPTRDALATALVRPSKANAPVVLRELSDEEWQALLWPADANGTANPWRATVRQDETSRQEGQA